MGMLRPTAVLLVCLLAACDARREEVIVVDPGLKAQTERASAESTTGPGRIDVLDPAALAAHLKEYPAGTEPYTGHHPNGLPLAQGFLCNGQPIGPWTYWADDGKPIMRGTYAYGGKRDGEWTAWHPNGRQRMRGTYRFGKEHGRFGYWYDNGVPSMRGVYDEGLRHGHWDAWHHDGMRAMSGDYIQGKKVGPWQFWDEDGRPLTEVDYSLQIADR